MKTKILTPIITILLLATIVSPASIYLNDIVLNVTASGIKKLGFNTTNELNTLYYPLNQNPADYATNTHVQNLIDAVNTTANIKTLGFITGIDAENLYLNISDQRYNDTLLINQINNTLSSQINSNEQNITFLQNNLYNNITKINFNKNPNLNATEGDLYWDAPDKTLALKGEDWTLQIGQELYSIVYNNKNYTIPNGVAVYQDGSYNGLPTISLARADNLSTSVVIGITTQTILPSNTGMVTMNGIVHDVNTIAFLPATTLYLSETNAGQLTSTKPLYPNYAMSLGQVITQDATTGSMFIRVRTAEIDPIWSVEKNNYFSKNNYLEGYLPFFQNSELEPSPIQVVTTDETYMNFFPDRTFYIDDTNGVVGVNMPQEESHKANFQVTSKIVNANGTLTVTSYDPILDQTLVTITGDTFQNNIDDASHILVNNIPYYVNYFESDTQVQLEGNVTFPSNSAYQIKIAPYADVFGNTWEERGYSISNESGAWQWAMYVPHNSNNTELCFQNRKNPVGDLMCMNENGDVNIVGTLNAKALNIQKYAGFNSYSGITDNGDGSVTLKSENATLYSDAIGASPSIQYEITGGRTGVDFPALADNSVNFIIVEYNAGTPIYSVIQDQTQINGITNAIYAEIVREGNDLSIINYDTAGNALAEKINSRLLNTQRFVRESGLQLGERSTRIITIGSGSSWHGSARTTHDAFDSQNNTIEFYYHNGSTTFLESHITQYNNLQYDNGSALITLGNGNYTVNWVYRSEKTSAEALLLLGNQQYATLADALESQPPTQTPIEAQYNAFLVGRIIVKKGENTSDIGSAFALTFSGSTLSDHAQLNNLQGGSAGQYYHLSLTDYNNVVNQVFLNKTDQRFNDTLLILAVNSSLIGIDNAKLDATDQRYNETALINGKLNSSDQRYNDTTLIQAINTSLTNADNAKLDSSDQRYNDTTLIQAINTSLTNADNAKLDATDQRYNDTLRINSLNSSKSATGICANGYAIQNTTSTGVQCTQFPSFTGINSIQGLTGITVTQSSSQANISLNTTYTDSRYLRNGTSANLSSLLVTGSFNAPIGWGNITDPPIANAGTGIIITPTGGNNIDISLDATYTNSLYLISEINITTSATTTTGNVVYIPVKNLTLYLDASSTYLVKCELTQMGAAATTGVQLQINTSGSPTLERMTYTKMSSASAFETFTGTSTTSNAFLATGSSTTQSIAFLNGIIITSANPSTYTVNMRSEISGSLATIDTGSYCQSTKIR